MSTGKLEIGYWKIRGLGAPLRMMATYAGVEYENKMYTSGEEWFGEKKPEILKKNPLANLPYVIDGDKVVCQTNSCMVYLAEKFGFYGGIKDLELLCEIYDLRNSMIELVYPFKKVNRTPEEFAASTEPQCSAVVTKYYAKFNGFLGKTKYLLKDTPCASDFHLWEMIDQHECLAIKYGHASPLANFPALKTYYENFKAEPKLKPYFNSDVSKIDINSVMGNAYFY